MCCGKFLTFGGKHFGVNRSLARVRDCFYWITHRKDIEEGVNSVISVHRKMNQEVIMMLWEISCNKVNFFSAKLLLWFLQVCIKLKTNPDTGRPVSSQYQIWYIGWSRPSSPYQQYHSYFYHLSGDAVFPSGRTEQNTVFWPKKSNIFLRLTCTTSPSLGSKCSGIGTIGKPF